MKSNANSKIIILITLGILFALSPIINNTLNFNAGNSDRSSENSDEINFYNENLKISAVSGKIHIKDNWTDAKAAEICTGNGTYSDPYVIEDLVIDGGSLGSCILIENSNVCFKIENCTLYNSGDPSFNTGIKLQSVSNGSLIANNISNCGYGIELCYSNNTSISGNTVNNSYYGIYFEMSDNNTISGNNVGNNFYGIYLRYSNNSDILGNTANYNVIYGIYLDYNCVNNNLSGNNARYNDDYGIYLEMSDNNTISGNIASNNMEDGIFLYYSDDNTITGNIANNNFQETPQTIMGITLFYSDYNTVSGNTVNNNEYGILLSSSNNNMISGNNVSYNYYRGIVLSSSSNNTVLGNNASYDNVYGINLYYSDNNTVRENIASYNDYHGIFLYYSDDNIALGNIVNNNDLYGIILTYSDNTSISGNTVNYNHYGIYLCAGDNNTVSGNIASYNDYHGIVLGSSRNNEISGNIMDECGLAIENFGRLENDIDTTNLVNGKPLYYYSNEIKLGPSNFTNAGQVILVNCNDSLISNLKISHSSNGISLYLCNNNTISGNTANYNTKFGILLSSSNRNEVLGNNANNNEYGIVLSISNNNTVSGNNANNNSDDGIYLSGNSNEVLGNNVSYNGDCGISLFYSDNNIILGNVVNYNENGIFLNYSDNNMIFLNYFQVNAINNAQDDGNNNQWDNGTIGNYWDDYDGVDANKDGIGDTPYDVPPAEGSVDNYPIWNVDDDPPNIIINSPTIDHVFGFEAPNFNITIVESNLDTMWYTLDGGLTNYTFSGFTGFINQTAWDEKEDGDITIRFYANDSLGHVGFEDVQILKDSIIPVISIYTPLGDDKFGSKAPEFNISIIEENLESTWYTIENISGTFPFTELTGNFDQDAWKDVPKGEITITFYAQDGAGNIGIESVIVIKRIPSQIPGYNLLFLLGTLSVAVILISKKLKKS